MTTSSHRHEFIVQEYYPRVDAEDVEWVIALFADDAVYHRADSSYVGKRAISSFYRGERKILGRHTLENIATDDDKVLVNGVFCGEGHDGSLKKVGFADVWQFDATGLVTHRQTYLAIGSGYVRE